ncbi:MAG: helix-turn-helix transcriptional regulator, partial [Candidatus Limnocylindrales bacterium]
QQHRVLAGATRSDLLAELRRADGALGVRALADRLSFHPNSVREQLAVLVEAGLVVRAAAAPVGRGRPSLRYAVAAGAGEVTGAGEAAGDGEPTDEGPYQVLAGVLADQLARVPQPAAASIEAGRRWGQWLAARPGHRVRRAGTAASPGSNGAVGAVRAVGAAGDVERLVELLDDAGFAPEPSAGVDAPVRLRHCPFGAIARERTGIVCNVHLGLMRGALAEMGASIDATSLEPWVAPDLCVAHLGVRVDG